MVNKVSKVGIEARDSAIRGAEYVANGVKSTLGPFGLNGMLEKGDQISNDGYKISSELCGTIEDEIERRGAVIAHQASAKTNDEVGDATTTAWVLWQAILKEVLRFLPNEKTLSSKKTPSEIKRIIADAKNEVIEKLAAMAKPVETKDELIKSALVSVEDEEVAAMLGGMQWDLGPDGIITPQEVNELATTIEKVNGIRIDNGFGTKILVTNAEKQTIELNKVPVLLTNYTLQAKDIMTMKEGIFNPLIANKKPGLVIIARAFSPEAIQLCVQSGQNGFPVFPINAPYVDQTEIMHDMETIFGARYIDMEESRLEDIFITDIGHCERLVARQFDAIVTGIKDKNSEARVANRVEQLKAKLKGEKSDFYKKNLLTRIAQLESGFAMLNVGAKSIVERGRLFDKCEDAVQAVRLALKGGTVKGAGLAFKEISDQLDDSNILKRPLRTINDLIMASAPEGWQVEEWVRDPFLVLKAALENACDVAGTFATTNIVVATKNPHECKCGNKNV